MTECLYLLPVDIVQHIGRSFDSSFKAFHLNVRSAKHKAADLECLFSQFSVRFNVIMLTETWYSDEADAFHLPSYKCLCLNRTFSRGGGVSVLIDESMSHNLLPNFCMITHDYEVLSLISGDMLISVVYRPPDGNVSNFLAFFESLLGFVSDNNLNVIIGGDFNINMLLCAMPSIELEMLLTTYGCVNVITKPTRITQQSETCIDLFITNAEVTRLKGGIFMSHISDHLPIFLCIKDARCLKNSVHSPIYFQVITPDNLERFCNDIANENWNDVLNATDPDVAYNVFLDQFKILYAKNFPYKKIKKSGKIRKPWITQDHLAKINIKDRLFQKFNRSKNPDDLKKFKFYRNQLTKELRNARTRYYYNSFKSPNGRVDEIWKKVNSVLQDNRAHDYVETLRVNGKGLKGTDLANAFNDHFVNLATLTHDSDACKYIKNRNMNSIFLDPVTEFEVSNVFINLKNTKSRDIDDIQIKPVKYVVPLVARYLTHIFNLCISAGVFPKRMQIAKVCVLHKKGDKNDINNYRPVSILPVFSKGLEKVIYARLVNFFDKHSLITKSQFGFRKHRSTELALLEEKEFILRSLEDRKLVLAVYVDFTKAFDYLNHKLLLLKLESYGVRGQALLLLQSYLESRKQYVCYNNFSSVIKPIVVGVPQGSILGPFLFNVYVNDILNIDPSIKFVMYADDTTLLYKAKDADELVHKINSVLGEMFLWTNKNALKININKTKAVMFRPKNKVLESIEPIILDSTEIELVDNFKTLGVVFSQNMSWDLHIQDLCRKLSKTIGLVCRHRYTFPPSVKMLLYKSLFYSYLNYCSLVWGTTTATNLEKIYLFQKRMLRIIANTSYLSHTESLFKRYNVLSVHELYNYRLSLRLKAEAQNNTSFLIDLSCLQQHVAPYTLRNSDPWQVPTCRLNSGMEMLAYRIPRLLNFLHSCDVCLHETPLKGLRITLLNLST